MPDDASDNSNQGESKVWKWTKAGGKVLYELTPVADAQHLYEGVRDGNYGEAAFSAFNLATTFVPVGKVAKLAKMAKAAKEAEAIAKAAKEAEALEKAAKEAEALEKAAKEIKAVKGVEEAAQIAAKEEQAAKAAQEVNRLEEAAKPVNRVEESASAAKATQSSGPPGECIPCKRAAEARAKGEGAVLTIRKPKILSRPNLMPEERILLEKQWRYKINALKNAAKRGELKWSPGTDNVRISQLQQDYRKKVIERYERRFHKKLDISRFDADHPIDMIVGGSTDQHFKLLDKSINRSVGSSLKRSGEKQGLEAGKPISEIRVED